MSERPDPVDERDDQAVDREAAATTVVESASEAVAHRIEDMPAADGAHVLADLPTEEAAEVAEILDPETAGHILAEMDPTQAAEVIEDMEEAEASMVLAAMDPDDRVDILEHLATPLHDRLVDEMDAADAAEVRNLEQYEGDTAGGIMTTEVTALQEVLTVGQAIEELRRLSEELEQMFYVYVVDVRGHLVGVLSMRDLILAKPDRRIAQIMRPNVSSVPVTMDQEEVARRMRKYGYLAMPVVDDRHRLVGLITVDDMVDVISEEATEDVQRMFGAGAEEKLTSPWQYSFRMRIWWLMVNLATAFLAAFVVGHFEPTIAKLSILAAYMPIVAGMGGNASAQAMAVAIRGIATGEVDRRLLRQILYRESVVGFLTGVVIGVATGLIAYAFHQDHGLALGLVIGAALLINHTFACITGVGVPFIMKRLGFDPAQSATIFATTITDVVGFFSLLGLATAFMKWLA
ncbi:MAG TPA: magnesium transporter [Tepidisphaeraceae bacterium]|jgi:magnesium transporter|nr:magnesium transporter [Tepidisphaeraceae bacterium]